MRSTNWIAGYESAMYLTVCFGTSYSKFKILQMDQEWGSDNGTWNLLAEWTSLSCYMIGLT